MRLLAYGYRRWKTTWQGFCNFHNTGTRQELPDFFQKVDAKKLEKAELQLQKKSDRRDNKPDPKAANRYKSNEATASQVHNWPSRVVIFPLKMCSISR